MGFLKKIKEEPVEFISSFLYMVIFILVNIPEESGVDLLFFITDNGCKEIIKLIIDIPYYAITLPILFSVLNTKNIQKRYYHYFHSVYVLLPMVLIGLYIHFERVYVIKASSIILLIVSCINAYCIEKKLKKAQEVNIQYLKYSNLVVSLVSTIIFSLISLFSNKLNIIHFLFFSSPLMLLQIVYNKIDLERKGIMCDNTKTEHPTMSITEEKQIENNKQGNATASGTISINLEIKI